MSGASANLGPGGQKRSRWQEAEEAVKVLAPAVCQADPDGVTVRFFSDTFAEEFNVRDAAAITRLFKRYSPGGTTDLAGALARAIRSRNWAKEETILVITDGQPDDEDAVARVIIAATQRMSRDEELSISFIQIGEDEGARRYLKRLDTELEQAGARFDIVDTKCSEQMKDMSFPELVMKSITS